jgi:hypothetical protein
MLRVDLSCQTAGPMPSHPPVGHERITTKRYRENWKDPNMSVPRAIVIASICLSLTAAVAQQREPPLFQGIMVDAKGKTIGRIINWNPAIVARQIGGVWVALPALVDGLEITDPKGIGYLFRSADCTG